MDTSHRSPAPGCPGGPSNPRPIPLLPTRTPYLQISHWGDNGEETGWRAQIWHTSQAGASKSPGSPETPLYRPGAACGCEGGGTAQEAEWGRVPHCSLRSAPCRAEKLGFCPGPWAHLRRWEERAPSAAATRGAKAEATRKGTPRRSVRAGVSASALGQSPRLWVPRKRVEWPASMGDA